MSRSLIIRGRRKLLALSAAVTLPLVLVACSADDGGSEAPADGGAGDGGSEAPAEAWAPESDVDWVVPYSPGGGFDTYLRGVAQVMKEKGITPDGVENVIRNTTPLPQGVLSVFSAEPDGLTVGILPMPAAVAQEIQTPDVARWVTEEFSVLGSIDENAYVIYVAGDSEYESIDDLIGQEGLTSLTVEQGSTSDLAAQVAIAGLGLDATMTYGAEGSAEVAAAALRGDIDFFVYGATDVVGFIESGDVRPLLFLGTEEQRSPELEWLQDVPSAGDAGFPDLEGVVTELRLVVAPPDLPEEVLAWWREAVWETISSPEFEEWAATAERPIVPRDWEGATEVMNRQIEEMRELLPQLEG